MATTSPNIVSTILSQHESRFTNNSTGLHPGKECGFDTDIHIPFVVRGPGVPAGHTSERVTSHTDIAPTVLRLAGATREEFDGEAIPLTDASKIDSPRSEHVNIEFWGKAIPEGIWGAYGDVWDPDVGTKVTATNNTYKGLRVVSQEYSLYYSVWCSGEKEYYDLKVRIFCPSVPSPRG